MKLNQTMKSKKEYRFNDNPEEKLFFETFIKNYPDTVEHISFIVHGVKDGGLYPAKTATPEEVDAFMATIQWLGSPVGQGFLCDMGYVRNNG